MDPTFEQFSQRVRQARALHPRATLAVPTWKTLLSDQLTPVLAYRRLVADDQRFAPSFLLESVEGGERQGRHSILGAQPALELLARVDRVERRVLLELPGIKTGPQMVTREADPLAVVRGITKDVRLIEPVPERGVPGPPACVLGGWFGYAAYDTARYAEPTKLPWTNAPPDDRGLPELHFALYDGVVVFDHVAKTVTIVQLVFLEASTDVASAYSSATARVQRRAEQIQRHSRPLPLGEIGASGTPKPLASNLSREQHAAMVAKAKQYIAAGDIFQVVLGQRFERESAADPFDVYRALRAVNPSPYMVYLQADGCVLVASSPEILCRVRMNSVHGARIVTNRPLAGTRKRGATPEEDQALERELLADPKERAEHIMLVDLGRNDVGRVCKPGTIQLAAIMEVERYSHVMHISSTVMGELREGLDSWDALRAALPVGTISGAPKIRAMQIIDELEPVRRGPYGGGLGYVGLDGQMDIALALRTMVVTPSPAAGPGNAAHWMYHLQASGGIVADSDPEAEYQETVNKAAALARALELAERAFSPS
jgi:anthranilate synthase component I